MNAARILVVDDSQDFLTYIESVLKKTDYVPVTVTDPREALGKVHEECFDLVLADINMTGDLSGFDLVKHIRGTQKGGTVPIALLTARKDKDDVLKALACGANDYIVKPVDVPLFLAKLEALLGKAPSAQTSFAAGYVLMDATWDSQVRILQINEKGMTIWSDLKPALEATIRIKSDFFKCLGIAAPPLRVAECSEDSSHPHRYFIKVNFIGLNDTELQKIRKWIVAHAEN